MLDYTVIITAIFAGFAVVEMALGRFMNRAESTPKDVILELSAGLAIPLLIVPGVLYTSPILVEALAPNSADIWAGWPVWSMALILVVADDLTQYWWHRLSHTLPWLYSLHRAHHSANYMSVRIVYRNSLVYYALMPGLWLSAALIHLGFGAVYVWYIVVKLTVIIGAHSSVPWDRPLLENRFTRPVMWWVCRIISTPMTHSAHHGRHRDDGVTHYKGNFGNLLFFWDVLFGTAKIGQRRPEAYGLEGVTPATWFQELIWPIGRSAEEYRNAEAASKHIDERTESRA